MADKLLAITGAAGRIGTAVRPFLRERYRLRLVDVQPIDALAAGETWAEADLRDAGAAARALRDVDAVLHLAGEPNPSATWPVVRDANIEATYNVFEAARRGGATKLVFASTNHVRGFDYLERRYPVDDRSPIRPDSLYAVSKAFGEALARYYVDAFGLASICLRIGWFTPRRPDTPSLNQLWISARDLAQLFERALETARTFGIYNGTSANRGGQWDIQKTIDELGFAPRDDVADVEVAGGPDDRPYVAPREGVLRGTFDAT